MPMQIDVDFDVYKALTARRDHEGHSYNDVLRDLLSLDSIVEPDLPVDPSQAADTLGKPLGSSGFYSRGLHLPHGTLLRARYKQRDLQARIEGDQWLDAEGQAWPSPSAAAVAVTGNNVNGLRFWEGKRPGDGAWRRLELLRNR